MIMTIEMLVRLGAGAAAGAMDEVADDHHNYYYYYYYYYCYICYHLYDPRLCIPVCIYIYIYRPQVMKNMATEILIP